MKHVRCVYEAENQNSQETVPISHVNAGFNNEIEVDNTSRDIHGRRYELPTITDRGTGWSKMCMIAEKALKASKECIEIEIAKRDYMEVN